MFKEFKDFLTQTNALALAVGVIIGGASSALVKAITSDIFTPILSLLTSATGDWKTAGFALKHDAAGKPTNIIAYGDLANEALNFVIISFVVFMITKLVIRPAPDSPSQTCPFCLELLPVEATKCKACTSELPAPKPA